jgi:hypothetical protein
MFVDWNFIFLAEETIKYINSIVNGKSRETIYLAFSNIAPVSVIEASFTNLQLL